tara:strand:- start:969 stop:1982 length:1014 start_codon:yes stop_codon:yes gene_type:complete
MKIDSVHAEFLSGNAVSTTVTNHSIVSRDGNGGVWATKLNSTNLALSHNATARTSDTIFYSSDDDIVRKNTAAGMRASLGLANSATITADSGNTGSAIVVRDASGDFSAGVIDANGEALSSLNASNLVSGTVSSARLSLSASDIPSLNASKITAGDITRPIDTSDGDFSGTVSFGSSVRQMINLWSTSYGIGVQNSTQYYRTAGGFAWFKGGSHDNDTNDAGSGGALAMKLDSSYNLTASGNVTAYSDKRIKTDISKIDNALEKVCLVSGYTYKRTDTGDERKHTGVIAQEVIKVLPEVVHGSEETVYSVAYGNMVGLLIEAIKELKSEIDELKKSK